MLDSFCSQRSDETQLLIAIRLVKKALPVWEDYFSKNPAAINVVNLLITPEKRISGGSETIEPGFLRQAVEKIERSYDLAKQQSKEKPVPLMKGDPALAPILATCIQPLQNKSWDMALPESVRLVFTSVFNILTWLQYRRMNDHAETHIYVAINQACDALMREDILSSNEINNVLGEYRNDMRRETEDDEWQNAFGVGRGEPLEQEDIFRMVIGEKVAKDHCGVAAAKEILRQMKEEGRSYSDKWEDYNTGTARTYSFNKETQSYQLHEFDEVVGSFSNYYPWTEQEMLYFIAQQKLMVLRESGFVI